MTKPTRRKIANRLRAFEEDREPTEWEIHTSVQVITPDMVDDNGNRIEEKVPDPEPPDGFELGDVVPTQSPVVTWYELEPTELDEE